MLQDLFTKYFNKKSTIYKLYIWCKFIVTSTNKVLDENITVCNLLITIQKRMTLS